MGRREAIIFRLETWAPNTCNSVDSAKCTKGPGGAVKVDSGMIESVIKEFKDTFTESVNGLRGGVSD